MGVTGDPLVEIDHASKHFDLQRSLTDVLLGNEARPVRAVDDVSLTIDRGEVVGIAGESGCGKTTLGKLLVKLIDATSGEIRFDGRPLSSFSREDEREFRKRVQMIFQDPFESLNPRMTVLDAVAEPLRINKVGASYHERRDRVTTVLEDVGLAPAEPFLDQFPNELSGGERQRVAIARALVIDPEFVVADEPVSMLDVSIRASVLNLMQELRAEYDLTYVFISHDLSLIRYMCDRTAIMYLGSVIEEGRTEDLVRDPKHPYTRALFDAVPVADPQRERRRANVTGEVPSARTPPAACRFHPRCPAIIAPDDWTGSQDAYRRFVQFRTRLGAGSLGVEDVGADPEDAEREEVVEALLAHGLVLDVPEEHRSTPEELTEGVDVRALDLPRDARDALEAAARAIVDGDDDTAAAEVEDLYPSICETRRPERRPVGGQSTACHLYEPAGSPSVPTQEPTD